MIAAVIPKNAVIEKEKKQDGIFCNRHIDDCQSDGRYCLDHAVTATQKVILNALGITPSTILNKAQKLS